VIARCRTLADDGGCPGVTHVQGKTRTARPSRHSGPVTDGVCAFYCNAGPHSDQSPPPGLAKGLRWPAGSASTYVLDIIGFDACLMSMYEVAAALAPYGRYLVASELLEPGDGWDYTVLGNVTVQGAAAPLSALDVGGMLVQSYMDTSARQGSVGLSMTVTDLGAAAALERDVLAVARGLAAQLKGVNGNGACAGGPAQAGA
jgi:hypothetical protein